MYVMVMNSSQEVPHHPTYRDSKPTDPFTPHTSEFQASMVLSSREKSVSKGSTAIHRSGKSTSRAVRSSLHLHPTIPSYQ